MFDLVFGFVLTIIYPLIFDKFIEIVTKSIKKLVKR